MYPGDYAKIRADEPAFIMATSGESVTFREYESRANRLAQFFRDQGLDRLDHVALFMENNPRLLECEGAAERSGLYYTLINSHLAVEEIAFIVNDCNPRNFITSWAMSEIAYQLPALCPNVERWLMVDTDSPQEPFEPYLEVLNPYSGEPISDEWFGAPMFYTSGTTGRPKGILRKLPALRPGDVMGGVRIQQTVCRFREGQQYLSPAPLYHGAPQASVAATMRLGGTQSSWSALIQRSSCNSFPSTKLRISRWPPRCFHGFSSCPKSCATPPMCPRWKRSFTPPRRAQFRSRSR